MTRDEILSDDEILRLARESGMSMLRGFSVDTQVFARAVERTVLERAKAPSAEPVAAANWWMRRDFETRMAAEGMSPTHLSRIENGEYLSPSVQKHWEDEKRKYMQPDAREAMRMALEALLDCDREHGVTYVCEVALLRKALGEK